MRRRPNPRFHPDVERFEAKRLLSAGPAAAHAHARFTGPPDARAIAVIQPAAAPVARGAVVEASGHRAVRIRHRGPRADTATDRHPAPLLLSRITQTSEGNAVHLVPPFPQVLVQARPPVRGRTYNVLSVAVRNHTSRTITAQDDFSVRLSGQSHSTPILTGDQVWKPGQFMVFYVLTHQYYPAHPVVSGGFEFDLDGSRGVAIPGPSGIFLRLPYRPATFARTLDWIIAYGPGAEGGLGPRYGLPDTQIWEFQ